MRTLGHFLAAVLLALGPPAGAGVAQSDVGRVAFENMGAAEAQAAFLRGLALLHNFEYGSAAEAFREAQAVDPGFAMAFWGEAMTYNHPLWAEQDAERAQAALARLGPDAVARATRTGSERERLYLAAVEALYGAGTKRERDRLYSEAMAEVHRRYPDDVDARALYALSLLGLAHDGRDPALYMRAAALLEEVYPENRDHPGVLHYLIHSYDDPVHAPLGLRAARRYGAIAPDAGHALHMTSHIFLPLGMWEDVAAANVAAMETVNRQRARMGRPVMHCHHYSEWLNYAEYQRGRLAEGDAGVEACRAEAEAELASAAGGPIEPARSAVRSYAGMAVRRLTETGQWAGAPALPEGSYLASRFTFAYGDLLAARDDLARLRAARRALEGAWSALAAAGDEPHPAEQRRGEIILAQAEALERLHGGDVEGGLAALRRAAETERSIPAEFGPPLIEKPTNELLGDELTRLGRVAEAREAYAAALELAPGRRLSLGRPGEPQQAAR